MVYRVKTCYIVDSTAAMCVIIPISGRSTFPGLLGKRRGSRRRWYVALYQLYYSIHGLRLVLHYLSYF
jgi:hypothetical protein